MRNPLGAIVEWLKDVFGDRRAPASIISRYDGVDALDHELLAAAGEGDAQRVRQLLTGGAMLLARGDDGATVLHAAAQSDSSETVDLVRGAGAYLQARDECGATPLHYAARAGATEATLCLLKARARVDASDDDGRTPLHYAALSGETEVARALVSRGGDLTARATKGCRDTPLHVAASRNQGEFLEAMLSLRELADLRNGQGDSLADYAAEHGHAGLAERLAARLTATDDDM